MNETDENEQSSVLFSKFLQKLKCHFLCGFPLQSLDWHDIPKDITWEQQEMLIDATYKNPLNTEYPLKIAYQLNFLKRLIQELEKISDEVHDVIYESLCDVQRRVAHDLTTKYAYKHYVLPTQGVTVTLQESKSFVAEGTTGLCSWQASLALADYLLHHSDMVSGRNVMELGSGTGLCGFILRKCCAVRRVLLTDGSAECVQLMRENFRRNFPAHDAEGELQMHQLSWHEIDMQSNLVACHKPEVLLAADVVYDDSVFDDLTHAIDFVFKSRGEEVKMLLAATVRNEETLRKFLQKLASLNFCIKDEPISEPSESFLHWDRSTAIRILSITRTQ